jgi:tetratricopeptide (TPR) repeat protein
MIVIAAGVLSLVIAVPSPGASAVEEALAQGDAHYARRAEGARGGVALPFHVDGAIADYRRALSLDPRSYEARLRLLRAFFFRGGFCGMDALEQAKLFEEAKRLAEETVKLLDTDVSRAHGHVDADAARRIAPAGEVYLWAAVSWGQWAVFHKVSAAWQGAPGRIRDLAEAVIGIDPAIGHGAGHLIMGRLNLEAPRIPMVTGWVSREKGLAHLRSALAIAPDSTPNMYFLALALLRLDPSKGDEARALLQRCATQPPRADYLVEDTHYADGARNRLVDLGPQDRARNR